MKNPKNKQTGHFTCSCNFHKLKRKNAKDKKARKKQKNFFFFFCIFHNKDRTCRNCSESAFFPHYLQTTLFEHQLKLECNYFFLAMLDWVDSIGLSVSFQQRSRQSCSVQPLRIASHHFPTRCHTSCPRVLKRK